MADKPLVLVVDDEPAVRRVLEAYLQAADLRVVTAADGESALILFGQEAPALVLLDIMLPGLDGLQVLASLRRRNPEVPVILLSARGEEEDVVTGLQQGADDYVPKPFRPRELMARVTRLLERTRGQTALANDDVLTHHDLIIDRIKHEATLSGRPLELTPSEFTLLWTLASSPGRTFTRLQLLEHLGEFYEGYERAVDTHIKNLRRKLGDDPKEPSWIKTVFGVGYKFVNG